MAGELQSVSENKIQGEKNFKSQLDSRQGDLMELSLRLGPLSAGYKNKLSRQQRADSDLRNVSNRLGGRAPQILFETTWIFILATIIILATEAAVNKILFDMALLSNSLVSVMASLLLSGFLVFLAHMSGFQLRQIWSDFHGVISWFRLINGLFCILFTILIVFGIMYTRAYFDSADAQAGNINVFSDVAAKIFTDGFSSFFNKAFSTPEAVVMGALNFTALLGAFIVAMFSHDSDYEYDRRYRVYKKLDKQLEKAQLRYAGLRGKIHKKYSKGLLNAKTIYIESGGAVEDLPRDDIQHQILIAETDRTMEAASATAQGASTRPRTDILHLTERQ